MADTARVLRTDEAHGRALNRYTTAILVGYLAFLIVMLVARRATVTPEWFAIFALVVACVIGRGRAFVRDWLPFIAILLAWQAMRGFAWQVGFPVQSDSVIAVERFLFLGRVPSEVLQGLLHRPGHVNVLDVSMAFVYLMHFTGTLTIAFVLWLKDRRLFYLFAATLLVLSVAQFATAIVLPVAPPRYAVLYGEGLAVVDIGEFVGDKVGLETLSWAYNHMNANPVAAFPSLHAAYPIVAALVLRGRWPRIGGLMAAYTAVVWFAIVYLGHHYVIDAIGGAVYAIASFGVVRLVLDRAASRTVDRTHRPA